MTNWLCDCCDCGLFSWLAGGLNNRRTNILSIINSTMGDI